MNKNINIDSELEMIKELFDIQLGPTIKGDELKGYSNGKFYLDAANCIQLSKAFLKFSHFLQMSNPNYDHEKVLESDKEFLFSEKDADCL